MAVAKESAEAREDEEEPAVGGASDEEEGPGPADCWLVLRSSTACKEPGGWYDSCQRE